MSSKPLKPVRRHWLWSSITGRLILCYTVSVAALLIVYAVILYWLLARDVERLGRNFGASEIHDFRTILHEHPDDRKILEAEVNFAGIDLQYPNYYARILDGAGQTVIETHRMSQVFRSSVFPAPAEASEPLGNTRRWTASDGRTYLLLSVRVVGGALARDQRVVQLALDVSQEEAAVMGFGRKLVGAIVLGIGVSVAVGLTIARLSLRPLQSITRAAQEITPTRLDRRISPSQWPQELVDLAQAFDEMVARLQDSFTRLSQFSADLAHELRTPINNLMGETEVILGRPRTAAEYREVLESGLEELSRISRLIDSLLFIARAESPATRIQVVPLAARPAIQSVLEFHGAVAQEQSVTLACEGDGVIHADPVLFRQALSNLLSNALRYTPPGGTVTVTVTRPNPQTTEVAVHDTGTGIGAEHLPRIFDRFYRADAARTRSDQGAGLGLAIVKSIVTLHGGTAHIASTPGAGTTVTLNFPMPT